MRGDVECPYCEKYQEINHDDGYGYEEDEVHNQECGDCGKTFTFTTSISYYYEAQKADCLNEGEHDWTPTHTTPVECSQMVCTMCDDRRTPTEEEMVEILKNRNN